MIKSIRLIEYIMTFKIKFPHFPYHSFGFSNHIYLFPQIRSHVISNSIDFVYIMEYTAAHTILVVLYHCTIGSDTQVISSPIPCSTPSKNFIICWFIFMSNHLCSFLFVCTSSPFMFAMFYVLFIE